MKKLIFLISAFTLIFSLPLIAQDAFSYQAVVRDSSGNVLANQAVGVQASIIQTDESLPPIYQETHSVTSNDYGVINLQIGRGISTLGAFAEIDWSFKSFLKVEIDTDGGTNYDLNCVSEILSVPKALYATKAGSLDRNTFGLNILDFGAKGDGVTDDTDAFEVALDSAEHIGGKIFIPSGIYKITRTLNIGDGVSLIGEGPGSDPLETPYNGSLLWYFGDDFAIKIVGHNARMRDLVIRDKSDEQAQGGILIEANGRLVESIHLEELLISGFIGGTAFKLQSKNAGGITYSSFDNVRIRHGYKGIEIEQDATSFVNSNTWNHCQVSGGGFKHGLYINGGNNNNFLGLIVEPYSTTEGHLYVEKGQIFCSEIRLEGARQPESIPLVYFSRHTKNSTITGVYAGGLTLDNGNNFINMKSGRAIHYRNSSFNKFLNATFFSSDNTTIPNWDISGNYETLEILEPELTQTHNVVKLTIAAGETIHLEPNAFSRPAIKDLPLYDQVNFGFYVKTTDPEIGHAYTNAIGGWTRSAYHSGSGKWEFVGMNSAVDRNQQGRFGLYLENISGETQTVYVSCPTLTFGNQLPTLDEKPLLSSGGQLYGLLVDAFVSSSIPGNGFLDLPRTANYFEIDGNTTIYRVNHQTANRFPKGSVITLLFNESGVGVTNSPYLNLKGGYTSNTNSSLTLISNGDGTWREVNRNE